MEEGCLQLINLNRTAKRIGLVREDDFKGEFIFIKYIYDKEGRQIDYPDNVFLPALAALCLTLVSQ